MFGKFLFVSASLSAALLALLGAVLLLPLEQHLEQTAPSSQPVGYGVVGLVLLAGLVVSLGSTVVPLIAQVAWLRSENLSLQAKCQEQEQQLSNELQSRNAEQESLELAQGHLDVMTQACQLAARRFETLFQSLPVAVIGFDELGTIFDSNSAVTEAFGLPMYGVMHRYLEEFVGLQEAVLVRRMLRCAFRGKTYRQVGWLQQLEGGGTRFLLVTVFPLPSADGSITAAMAAFEDASEQYLSRRLKVSAVNTVAYRQAA